MLTCIHRKTGLCESCRADYEADPQAWEEFGNHPAGLARWEALQAEMDAERRKPAEPIDWTDVPI